MSLKAQKNKFKKETLKMNCPWKIKAANIDFLRSSKVRNYMAENSTGKYCIDVKYDLNGRITGILYPHKYNASKKITDCATLIIKTLEGGKYFISLNLGEDVDRDVRMTLEETIREFNNPKQI
jgi:hypothetical protein